MYSYTKYYINYTIRVKNHSTLLSIRLNPVYLFSHAVHMKKIIFSSIQ
jgi:hypothetical protein